MGRSGSSFAGLFIALNFAVKLGQSRVLNGAEFALECRVGGADLKHHAHQIVDGYGRSVRLINEGEEFVSELNDGLALFLSRVEELLPPEVDRVHF